MSNSSLLINQSRLLSALLACVVTVSLSVNSFAIAKRVTLMGLEAKTQENQIVMYLSDPARASISTPVDEKGNKTLLIDLQGVQVPKVDNKEDLLEAIKNALPDVSQITMSEFNGTEPMLRLAIKTSSPDIQGSLLSQDGNELILQLQNPNGPNRKTITRVVESSAYIGTREGIVQTPSITPTKAPNPYVSEDRYLADRTKAPATSFREYQHREQSFPHQYPEVSASSIDNPINIDLPPSHTTDKYRADALSRGVDGSKSSASGQAIPTVRGQVLDNSSFSQQVLKPATSSSRVYGQVADNNLGLSTANPQALSSTGLDQLKSENLRLQSQLSTLQQSQSRLANLETSVQQLQTENGQLRQQVAQASSTSQLSASSSAGHLVASVGDLSQANMGTLVSAENAFRQGIQFERAGQLDKAASSYSKAIQVAPQVPEYAAAIGRLYIDQRQLGPARQALTAGLQSNPGNTEILNELGKVALLEGKTDEASGLFSQALPSGVMSNYASTLMKQSKFPDAERAYLVAIASNPKDADLYYNLGNLYLAQQQYTNAIQLYQSALKYQSNLPEAHYQMGIAYAQSGQNTNAVQALRNYLNMLPTASNRKSVEQFIGQLQRGG